MSKAQYKIGEPMEFQIPIRKPPIPWTQFCYNQDDGTILGRTPESWAKIGIFYTIFYAVLIGLVAICYWVFDQTIDPRIPKWKMEEGLIGRNPGLGFRPLPPVENVESTLIWYKGTLKENYAMWTDSLTAFIDLYDKPGTNVQTGSELIPCDYNTKLRTGQICNVPVGTLDPCIKEKDFNYHKNQPCVFLKLNKIYGWVPEYINTTDNFPDKMPEELKDYLRTDSRLIKNPKERNTIWISCEGENPADVEHIGPINYLPKRGFPGYYYPYQNAEGYLSPLVAVHFENPYRGVLINIECKAWAHNIKHNRKDKLGSVHFELMID